ncbi:oxidoreductase [Pseudooceanicola sediminis]|mgnify:CR=1 FL=1|uniref:Oxidoreductase n=1 Tax=Pseudooceanicola sediminis TaxID=2211117 RepID=A0A399IYD8_9RHOB|nr:molybdopterin-dependent oxidoreductase [Pseudooceanicola sediminis]RII37994.1 oxidoreductase [Pseudooceanicola sediminis]
MKLLPSLAALLTGLMFANMSLAEPLAKPVGDVVLTVSGNISNTNDGEAAKFDRAMLEEIGMVDISTNSPWYDEVKTFSGVPMKDLMELVGAKGTTINAVALNDYETEVPMSDAQETGMILAMKLDGQDMEVRDKGPIFLIYPYDSNPTFQNQAYYARSAWQVTRLIVR